MNSLGYALILNYATPPNNYFGTSIFLSYILAALYASFTISVSLYRQYTSVFSLAIKYDKLNAIQRRRAQHVKIYAMLASLSFAILSYNMLMFLVTHYTNWCSKTSLSISNTSRRELGIWMLESNLFRDFTRELVQNANNMIWSQAAILKTWLWNIWIARKARQYNIDATTMRTYILLSQILPISFTVCLFIIQLHLLSPDVQPVGQGEQQTKPHRKPSISLQLPNLLLNLSFLTLPFLRDHPSFSTAVLLERVILLLPHFERVSLTDQGLVNCLAISGIFVATNVIMVRKELSMIHLMQVLGQGGFAVRALGWDAVFGAAMSGLLTWDATI